MTMRSIRVRNGVRTVARGTLKFVESPMTLPEDSHTAKIRPSAKAVPGTQPRGLALLPLRFRALDFEVQLAPELARCLSEARGWASQSR